MFTALIPTEVCFPKTRLGRPSYFCRLKQKYKDFVSLSGIDDEFENLAHDTTIKRIMGDLGRVTRSPFYLFFYQLRA